MKNSKEETGTCVMVQRQNRQTGNDDKIIDFAEKKNNILIKKEVELRAKVTRIILNSTD